MILRYEKRKERGGGRGRSGKTGIKERKREGDADFSTGSSRISLSLFPTGETMRGLLEVREVLPVRHEKSGRTGGPAVCRPVGRLEYPMNVV